MVKIPTAGTTLTRRSIVKGAGTLAMGVAAPAFLHIRSAYAAYPDRPVKVVVANTPGGPSDLVGRMITAALQQSTGKSFIIENIGGACGAIWKGKVVASQAGGQHIPLLNHPSDVLD